MSLISRRELIESAAVVGGWMILGADAAAGQQPPTAPAEEGGPYRLPPLPYGYGELEPFIEAQVMKLHYGIHHAGYVINANAAVAELEAVRRVGGDEIKRVRTITESLAFNLSGHVLHTLFWRSMKKAGGGDPPADSETARLIRRDFGSLEAFRANLAAAAAQVHGNGWALLVYEPLAQRLLVLQAEKHENTAVWGTVPLLALDVWEHAYYLQYQNRRSEYIKAFLELIDWAGVEERLQAAIKLK